MKTTLFKITTAMVAISYLGCNSPQTVGVETSRPTVYCDSLVTFIDSMEDDDWVNEPFLATSFGDGDSAGEHNITIIRDGGVAYAKLIKSNGINQKSTVIDSVNLSTHTARIALNAGNVVLQSVGAGHLHNGTLRYVAHTSNSDFKITDSSPLMSGNAFVVGAEDQRLGVTGRRATHTVYKLPTASSSIRVSQNNASTLRISRWSFSTVHEFADLAYCDSLNQSSSGVNYWGENFSYYCQ